MVKFRCRHEGCNQSAVRVEGLAFELLYECRADSVSACFEDPPEQAQFIVLKPVPKGYVFADNSY